MGDRTTLAWPVAAEIVGVAAVVVVSAAYRPDKPG
jgi:hypothetical protein